MLMNVQLHHVVSAIPGATGMQIIRALVAGHHAPALVASYRDSRCPASVETIPEAFTGHYGADHVFALRQALA